MQALAVVRLSPGQVGFYDELTRIHLTVSNPEKTIFKGMNTSNIKRAVHSGRLRLISGSLEPEKKVVVKDINVEKKAVEPKAVEPAAKPKKESEPKVTEEAPVVEEVLEVVEEAPAEAVEVVETAVEETVVEEAAEVVAEEKPAKRNKKK